MNAQEPSKTECLSEMRLDRWVAGEVASAERAEIEAHLRGCLRCSARWTAREKEKRHFKETAPPLPLGRPVTAASAPVPQRRFANRRAVGAAAALVTALAAGFLIGPAIRQPAGDETVIGKGQQRLRFFVRDGAAGTVREGRPEERVYPGDQIRFAFDGDAVRGRRVAVLGRDAAGKVSVYFPHGGTQAIAPPASADGLVPYSIKLDETLGPETLFALYCPDAVALGPLQAALASDTPPSWPAVCQVETVLLDKKPRR